VPIILCLSFCACAATRMVRRPHVQVTVVGSLSVHRAARWAQLLHVYDAYNVFPPSCCAQLRHLRGRGLLVAIKNCTQIVNARFRTRSCLLLFMLFPALHLGVYERLHLERGID
jgi:hypothetical protein